MSVTITRSELYAKVWERPMVKVAADYGISDVVLKKICTKHRIPVPGRGHWAKKAAGKKVYQTKLRKLDDPAMNEIVIYGSYMQNLPDEVLSARSQAKETVKRKAMPEPETDDDAAPLHPTVERTRKKLERKKRSERGLILIEDEGFFDIRVGQDNIERVIGFLSRFVSRAENNGYLFERGESHQVIAIDGETLPFWVEEEVKRSKHQTTPEEHAAVEKWRARQVRRGWNSWEDRPTIPEWDYTPTGKLSFRIGGGWYDGIRRTFADGKTQTIEKLLDDILIGLTTCAAAQKQRREEDERRTREREERARRAEEERRKQALERKRVEALSNTIQAWKDAQEIREYVDQAEEKLIATSKEEHDQLTAWIEWAKGFADQIDPLKGPLPQLLGYEDFNSWDLR